MSGDNMRNSYDIQINHRNYLHFSAEDLPDNRAINSNLQFQHPNQKYQAQGQLPSFIESHKQNIHHPSSDNHSITRLGSQQNPAQSDSMVQNAQQYVLTHQPGTFQNIPNQDLRTNTEKTTFSSQSGRFAEEENSLHLKSQERLQNYRQEGKAIDKKQVGSRKLPIIYNSYHDMPTQPSGERVETRLMQAPERPLYELPQHQRFNSGRAYQSPPLSSENLENNRSKDVYLQRFVKEENKSNSRIFIVNQQNKLESQHLHQTVFLPSRDERPREFINHQPQNQSQQQQQHPISHQIPLSPRRVESQYIVKVPTNFIAEPEHFQHSSHFSQHESPSLIQIPASEYQRFVEHLPICRKKQEEHALLLIKYEKCEKQCFFLQQQNASLQEERRRLEGSLGVMKANLQANLNEVSNSNEKSRRLQLRMEEELAKHEQSLMKECILLLERYKLECQKNKS